MARALGEHIGGDEPPRSLRDSGAVGYACEWVCGAGWSAAGSRPRVCDTRGSVCHRERVGGLSGDREGAEWDTVGVGEEMGVTARTGGRGLGCRGV